MSVLSCSPPTRNESPPVGRRAALPAGIVARAGVFDISSDAVRATMATQAVAMAKALEFEIADALFASGAVAAGLQDDAQAAARIRGQLARTAIAEIREAASADPPTDQEIAEVTALHFMDFDRPEAFRTIHALVKLPRSKDGNQDPIERSRAHRCAERVASAVVHASTAQQFRELAEQVECSPFELTVEDLKPVAEDGRVIDLANPKGTERYVDEFARAAAKLSQVGQTSGIVESPFGFHVLMLLERQPDLRVSLEARRDKLTGEVLARRAEVRLSARVKTLRGLFPTTVERSADTLLQSLVVAQP